MFMRWLHLLFMHWPVPVESLRAMQPAIPKSLEIDTYDGMAWVGLVPFTMRDVGPCRFPPLPIARHFHECNVRTYVSHNGVPGVWFYSLDAASRLAVWGARRFFHLPYHHARMSLERDGNIVRYNTTRSAHPAATLGCAWEVGDPLPRSTPGSLEHFLTERYALYAADRHNRLFRGDIAHQPWPLRTATLQSLDDGLLAAAGLSLPQGQPPAHIVAAESLDVDAWWLKRLDNG